MTTTSKRHTWRMGGGQGQQSCLLRCSYQNGVSRRHSEFVSCLKISYLSHHILYIMLSGWLFEPIRHDTTAVLQLRLPGAPDLPTKPVSSCLQPFALAPACVTDAYLLLPFSIGWFIVSHDVCFFNNIINIIDVYGHMHQWKSSSFIHFRWPVHI